MKVKFVGDHADTVFKGKEDELKHVPVGNGDTLDLTTSEVALSGNKQLFDDGKLIEVKEVKS